MIYRRQYVTGDGWIVEYRLRQNWDQDGCGYISASKYGVQVCGMFPFMSTKSQLDQFIRVLRQAREDHIALAQGREPVKPGWVEEVGVEA